MSLASPLPESAETRVRSGNTFFPLILLFFLLSGISGLIYEVIWTRLLLTVFGATLYAVSTVLAAYMGGLALGSFVGGKVADRVRNPLRFYGILEIIVAIFAVSVPYLLSLFDPIYRAVYATNNASFLQLSLLRFVLSFIVLLIPTTCMGATLPVLSRFLVRRSGTMGARIGGLYAINTFGAVVGAFLAGFIFIARFGVNGTVWLAAVVSALVGVGAWVLSIRTGETKEEKTGEGAGPTQETPLTGLTGGVTGETPAWLVRVVLATYAVRYIIKLYIHILSLYIIDILL